MTVTPTFKWTISILATLALAIVVADRIGWIDKLLTSKLKTDAAIATKASNSDGFLEDLFSSVENLLPRLFSGTTDITKALDTYAATKNPARRTELAYDLFALKFRSDLRSKKELTKEQEAIYENAMSHLKWTQDLLNFYLARIPENNIGRVQVKFGPHEQTLQPSSVKKILVASFSPAKDQCTNQDLAVLRESFPDEFLAINLTDLGRVFLILKGQIDRQLMNAAQGPLIASVQSQSDREVLESVLKIRMATGAAASSRTPHDNEILNKFFAKKDNALAFNVYSMAPGCFTGSGIMAFVKLVRRLQTEVRAKFVLDLVRAYYKKTNKIPEDLYEFRIESPKNDREEFYRRPTDGWGSQFEVKAEGNKIQILSIGPDHKAGTADDFVAAEGEMNATL